MSNLSLCHRLHCDEATFWNSFFFNRDFLRALYLTELGFRECTFTQEQSAEGNLVRNVHYSPPLATLPGAIQKAYGDSLFYEEKGTLDRKTGSYQFRHFSSALGDKVDIRGKVWCVQGSRSTVDRHVIGDRVHARLVHAVGAAATSTRRLGLPRWIE
jgi:hypothetical protein